MNNQEYTLKTVGEYANFLKKMEADPENTSYMNKIYRFLNDMKSGSSIEVEKLTIPANIEKFIGCVSLYLWDTNKIEFSSDYLKIRKL